MSKLTVILVLCSCMNSIGFSQVKPAEKKTSDAEKHYLWAIDVAASKPDSGLYYYSQYRKMVSPTDSLALRRDLVFYNFTGTSYLNNYFSDSTLHPQDLGKALMLYKKVLRIDSINLTANINSMLAYYNIGVNHVRLGDYCKQRELIKNTDWNKPDSEIPSLAKLLECIKPEEYEQYHITPPFRNALPYALRAYRLDPSNKKTLEALQGIYTALADKKQADIYKAKFEKLSDKK